MDKVLANSQEMQVTAEINCPLSMPKANGFLWNKQMVLQVNCRGYVNGQYMQPEPRKYSYGPNLEEKTFIQPEHSYFAHHPGRFFYIKDEESQQCFSAPYEPMRVKLDSFRFVQTPSEICWYIEHLELEITIKVSLTAKDVVERWSLSVNNLSSRERKLSIYPYFSIGYMSWMNQSATFDANLNAIVASAITPYQKVEQYFENTQLKEKTFLLANETPNAWHAQQYSFEGEGGLHNPDALKASLLSNKASRYETPVAVLQYKKSLSPSQKVDYQFLFGPAKNEDEISHLRDKYFDKETAQNTQYEYDQYIAQGQACLTIKTDKPAFDDFVNHWLPRQMFYHGDVNRLSTDPQTRNYIQDNMGMCYINPNVAREAFILTLSQQKVSGAIPDGVLLHKEATLKYINQIPHTDHCVWLPICLSVYLSETNDYALLDEKISFGDSHTTQTFAEHIELALDWLMNITDDRGLSLIEQGDWCDPMNMVGYKGKGVSSWLSLASAYALNSWCDICEQYDAKVTLSKMDEYRFAAKAINEAVNKHLWHDKWFARGITDDNRVFGTANDSQGKIYLNPQSWAMLSGAANAEQQEAMVSAIDAQLMTPFGVMMLAPSYTHMVEDIGRLTQKHPGVSENGSVYNHAAIFYVYSLYQTGRYDLAFEVLNKIIPCHENQDGSGQLPIFVPNYYRGAFHEFPEQAGRSSQLFNTGTLAWLYRCLVEELCGLKGERGVLTVNPKLPSSIDTISGKRVFQDATVNFTIEKSRDVTEVQTYLNSKLLSHNRLTNLTAQQSYQVHVLVPYND